MPARSQSTRRSRFASVILAASLLAAVALTGCGSDGSDVELVEGVREEVAGLDNSFAPEDITIPAGAEIMFANRGRNDHNVIPADEDQDWTIEVEDFKPGAPPVPVRFTEPGTYDYFCSIHGTATAGMIGSITVEG